MLRRAVALVFAVAAALWLLAPAAPPPVEAQVVPTSTFTRTPTRTPTATTTPTVTPTFTATPGPWPGFQHDSKHTGRSQFSAPSRVGQLWSYPTGLGALTGGPLVGADGTVYVGVGGYLYAFSPGGAALWRLQVGSSFGTLLQANDGTLYATGATGLTNTVYQVWYDGTILSRFQVTTGSFFAPLALALGPDGTVYFGVGNSQGTGGSLYALTPNLASGNMDQKWTRPLAVGFLAGSQPAVDPDTGYVYVGTYDVGGSLLAISPGGTVGTIVWRTEALGYINSSPSIDTDGTIFIGASGGLYAVNPNGLVKWVYRTSVPINYSSPAIDLDGTVYVGAGDALLAIDRLGALRWRQSCLPGGRVNSSAAISADGNIYYQAILSGSIPSAALCMTDATGVLRWAYVTQYSGENGPQVASPAIGGDGTIYVGSPDGVLFGLVSAPANPLSQVRLPLADR